MQYLILGHLHLCCLVAHNLELLLACNGHIFWPTPSKLECIMHFQSLPQPYLVATDDEWPANDDLHCASRCYRIVPLWAVARFITDELSLQFSWFLSILFFVHNFWLLLWSTHQPTWAVCRRNRGSPHWWWFPGWGLCCFELSEGHMDICSWCFFCICRAQFLTPHFHAPNHRGENHTHSLHHSQRWWHCLRTHRKGWWRDIYHMIALTNPKEVH